MNYAEMVRFIVDNLKVEVEVREEFGPINVIEVKLTLAGNLISKSSEELPE